jgi:hypothetical protein
VSVAEAGAQRRSLLGGPLLAVAALVYAAGAAALSPTVYADVLMDYSAQLAALPPLLLIGLAIAGLVRGAGAPVAYVAQILRERGGWFGVAALLVCLALSGFTTYKLAIPHIVPFYADPALGEIDRVLHGVDPGMLLQALVPAPVGYAIGYLYGPVWFLAWFCFMGLAALLPDQTLRWRYFASLFLVVLLLGTVLATLLSSVGPYLYDRLYGTPRFGDLSAAIDASAVGNYMREATDYLMAGYAGQQVAPGTGMSAMPSMHIAIGTLDALLLAKLGRVSGLIGWTYLVLLFIGSVYMGWHYAIDGYVSLVAVVLTWAAVGRLQRRWA